MAAVLERVLKRPERKQDEREIDYLIRVSRWHDQTRCYKCGIEARASLVDYYCFGCLRTIEKKEGLR